MKNIRITQRQLKTLKENINDEYMQMNELGDEEYSFDDEGEVVPGGGHAPSAEEMADMAINQIKLHPSFYENRDKMYDFLSIFTQKLEDEVQGGGLEPVDYDKEMTTISRPQLNENLKEIKIMMKKLNHNK